SELFNLSLHDALPIYVALNNRMREREGKKRISFDPFFDLDYFAETLLAHERIGIFTIGGGVPRNWSQQFGPYCELRHRRTGEDRSEEHTSELQSPYDL